MPSMVAIYSVLAWLPHLSVAIYSVSYAVKQFVVPKVSQWYHEWRKDDDKTKAEEEQQKTAQLVADAIQAQV